MKKYTQIGKHSVWDNFEQSGNFENNERRFLGLSRVKVFKDSTGTVMVTDGKRAFSYSRTGTQFKTLGNATKEIKNLYEENKLIQKSKRGTKVATVKAKAKKTVMAKKQETRDEKQIRLYKLGLDRAYGKEPIGVLKAIRKEIKKEYDNMSFTNPKKYELKLKLKGADELLTVKKNKSKRGTKVATVKAKAKKTVMTRIIEFRDNGSELDMGETTVDKYVDGIRQNKYLYSYAIVNGLVHSVSKDGEPLEKVTYPYTITKDKNKKSKRGTKVATVKASPKKSAKTKTVKKTTNKKVMSVVKTESKGKRVSEKVLRASNKPSDKVLYVVLRMKKLVVAQMQENAVKGKKEAKEVKQIVRAFSNQMTGISAGIKDAKLEELKAIAIKLKTVVKDINVSKYNSKMKDIFSGLAENYPQPTREATKFSIEKDFLDF